MFTKINRNHQNKKRNIFIYISVIFTIIFLLVILIFNPKVKLIGDEKIILNINSKYVDQGLKVDSLYDKAKAKIIINSDVNTKKEGIYYIDYIYNYKLFRYKIKRTVIVKDIEKPMIILNGGNDVYYCPNGKYKELGYKALDNVDGNITNLVKIDKKKDKIIYSCSDSSNNKTVVVRKLNKKDIDKPEITLNGLSTVFVPLNSNYNEEGVRAFDLCDKDLSNNIKITNNIDTSKIGTYEVIYTVKDKSNNKAVIKRNVKVMEPLEKNTIYLTFDDGPRSGTTDQILDILKEKNIKATFFVTGNGPDDLIKRIVLEGHSIGIHTSTHNYAYIYSSVDNYFEDLEQVYNRIYNLTGVQTNIIRFPGGSSNTISQKYSQGIMSILTSEVINRGYQYYDWNIESGDSSFARDADKIYNNIKNKLDHDKPNIILMHDTKTYTKDALGKIIDYGIAEGYTFKTITSNTMLMRQRVSN